MMAKPIKFILISVLILLIGAELNAKVDDDDDPVYTRYVAEITRAFSKQVKKEFGLECEGNGGCMPFDVEEIHIKFLAHQRATVEEARELEVLLTERFIEVINAHEKIKPFLRECPFPPSRVRVGISFCKKNNKPYTDGSVAYVSQVKSKIYYRAENPNNPYVFDQIKNEPYEEAAKIVHRKKLMKITKKHDGTKAD